MDTGTGNSAGNGGGGATNDGGTNTTAVKRQRRASRPKVKTGCNHCKSRRVKCDETRPQCMKCVKSGRHCSGYPAYKRTVEVAVPIAPRPGSIAPASTLPGSSLSAATPPRSRVLVRKTPRILHAPHKKIRKPSQTTTTTISRITPPATPVVRLVSPTVAQPGGFTFDAQEGQYFQVFRTHTASELSGYFDSEFWTRSVLQEGHSQASIRHAIVALGALYKTLEKASESPPGSPDNSYASYDTAPSHYNFALQQYTKAVSRLRESLQNNETRSHRTILISIVLFTCFESFTGNHKAAISQIQSGLGLLEERRQDVRQPMIPSTSDHVEDELVQIFTRLAIQAKSYDMAFHFPDPYVIRLSPQTRQEPSSPQTPGSPSDASTASMESSIPEVFLTSREARSALDKLCESIMRFNEELSSFHRGPNHILPRFVQSQSVGFRTQLQQWERAFAPLLEGRRHAGVPSTERAGIIVLRMSHVMSSVLFYMGYSTSEFEFDKYIASFQEIVNLASELVLDEELTLASTVCGTVGDCRHKQRASRAHAHFPGLATQRGLYREEDTVAHIKASFALDLGIVPPLFVVATKCRDRRLRREAIRLLLSSPRREGMWDSVLSARAAQWIMEIEEEDLPVWQGIGSFGSTFIVPDGKRVMVKEILFDLQAQEATLRCGTRGGREGEYDQRARKKDIWW